MRIMPTFEKAIIEEYGYCDLSPHKDKHDIIRIYDMNLILTSSELPAFFTWWAPLVLRSLSPSGIREHHLRGLYLAYLAFVPWGRADGQFC